MEGKVKFFNDQKGFGFITDSQTGEDVFVHSTGLVTPIAKDNQVSYDTEEGKKGLKAVNVRKITNLQVQNGQLGSKSSKL